MDVNTWYLFSYVFVFVSQSILYLIRFLIVFGYAIVNAYGRNWKQKPKKRNEVGLLIKYINEK